MIETKFPDGQLLHKAEWEDDSEISIRLSSWDDFQRMLTMTAALKRKGHTDIILYAPYIMGSRSDRSFEEGGMNYVKDVLAPLINSQGFSKVITLDPHSMALENAINNLEEQELFPLIVDAISEITNGLEYGISIISPDFGAYKKVNAFCQYLNKVTSGACEIDFVSCEKVRSLSGEITHTKVSHTPKFNHAIIIDDICDGGRTFIEISKALDGFHGELYLWVTHGIFSKGLKELSKHFEKIYTTNSVMDIDSMYGFGMLQEKYIHKINQTKVI